MHEKRAYSRKTLDVDVNCQPGGGGGFTGRSKDISLGGMFIYAEVVPPFGDRLTLELAVPGATTALLLPAVVRWSDKHAGGFGVQFGLLGARETHAIVSFMGHAG